MSEWDKILRTAKSCHTKKSWEELFRLHDELIRSSTSSKQISELFKLLKDDSQCLEYDPTIWETLLEACLSAWDLEIGQSIANFATKSSSAIVAIASAKVFTESGQPITARKIANRATRLTGLTPRNKLRLEMIICNSYVDEGKRAMAIRLLNKMEQTVVEADLTKEDRAQFLANIARTNFFLGRYAQAGKHFYQAYEIYLVLENWYEAARSVYNSASGYFSAGGKQQSEAFALVEECRRLSEAHNLLGPLSHVEAFYGHDDYWHGNFAGARDHYRRAHKYIPTSDQSYRTLHILSMLAFIYLRTGQYGLAHKFGDKTLELASTDASQRFKSRYHNLRAELMWEKGDINKSQEFLNEKTSSLISKGVNTLEELSTVSRFFLQAAKLGNTEVTANIQISEQLKKNTGDWLEFLHGKGQLHLSQGQYSDATDSFENCKAKAKQYGDRYHYCLSILGLIQTALANNSIDDHLEEHIKEFEISVARLVETPLRVHTHMIRAGLAYRDGRFDLCKQHLENASSVSRMSFSDKFVIDTWLATICGRSIRLNQPWQRSLTSHFTKIYFAPSFSSLGNGKFMISRRYPVDLSNHTAIADMLEYLLQKNKFAAKPDEIQEQVWKQSTNLQGWRQKIRNTITRLRDLVPYSMAPLVLHKDSIELFSEAIKLKPILRHDADPKDEILRLLKEGPMSTVHLSNRLNVSSATTKRILKKLSENDQITIMKVGRKVLYQAIDSI